jgi:hypothetical protein
MTSCEDYLDKAPESSVNPEDAFKNFRNFQGFTEELYYCIPDFAHGYWNNSFNWGEDELISFSIDYHMGYKVDMGDFWGWQSSYDGWQCGWMDRNNTVANSSDRTQKSLWPLAWYGIRKCNLGLENIDKLVEATEEQRDLILGQLYFFRGWFHFELMQYFGGLPYIDSVPSSSEPLRNPRLSYQECADRAAEDFRRAADLLPIDWDDTTTGKATYGNNQQRINKIRALCYGKDILILDEPSSALDLANQQKLLYLLQELSNSGITVIMTTHSANHALKVSYKTLMLFGEDEYIFGLTKKVVNKDNLSKLFGTNIECVDYSINGKSGIFALTI